MKVYVVDKEERQTVLSQNNKTSVCLLFKIKKNVCFYSLLKFLYCISYFLLHNISLFINIYIKTGLLMWKPE